MAHLNPVELRLWLESVSIRERQVVEHLLGCTQCRAAVDRELDRTPAKDARYDREIANAIARVSAETRASAPRVTQERAEARRLLDELWTHRSDHWPAFFLQSSSPAFLLLVLETAARVVLRDPNTAETLARHVHEAAERAGEELPELLRAELIARAWAAAGRARAQREEWGAAEDAYGEASRTLNEFPNLEAEAELCRFQAAAFAARERMTEAVALLGRAAQLAEAAGQVDHEIEDLGELAQLHSRRGDLDQAVGVLIRALLRAEDSGLEVSAAHLRLRLSWTLRQLGELRDALSVAPPAVRSAFRADASDTFVAALAQAQRGETSAAAEKLEAALYGGLMDGDGLLAALAALTVLTLYILEDRGEKLQDLAPAVGLLAEPQNGLAPATRAALSALERALQADAESVGALLLAAAAAVDRHEGPEESAPLDT